MTDILKLLEQYTAENPNGAILFDDAHAKGITYAQLDEMSGRVYAYLKQNNIGKENFVLIDLPRGILPIIAMIGVWKAGAAWALVEDTYAPERISFIRSDCGCKLELCADNWEVFENYSLEPGFRIFHVYAKCLFLDEYIYTDYERTNQYLRDKLIHNVKNEFSDPDLWGQSDLLFHEGDALTPEGAPNTGISYENIFNGRYTGISFTDFVTGDEPSFKVSFSGDPVPEAQVNLTLDYEELKSDAVMEVTADAYITCRRMTSVQDNETYTPYLLGGNDEKLSLDLEKTEDPYTFKLSYQGAYPLVEPNTEYTLVIPKGCFKAGYNQDVPEFRQKVMTSNFFALTVISSTPNTDMKYLRSNLFAVTESTYGIIRIPTGTDNGHFIFTEYNLNGEEILTLTFDVPEYDRKDNHLYRVSVKKLNDGNFALILSSVKNNYFVKIDRQGRRISDVYTVSDESVSDYASAILNIDFDLYKGGLCKLLTNDDWQSAMLIIDFETEPTLTEADSNYYYYSLDSETYAEVRFYDRQSHVLLFNTSDEQIADIDFNAGFLCAFEEKGQVTILKDRYDRDLEESFIYADTYSKDGELISSIDITENAETINNYGVFNRCIAARDGYFLEIVDEFGKTVVIFDKNWVLLGSFNFDWRSNYTFVGNCGITGKTQSDIVTGTTDVVSRFSVGEFEIVPEQSLLDRLLGDVDGDGEVTILDATFIQRKLASIALPFEFIETVADTDGDSIITILDATYIQRWLASLPSNDRIGKRIISI